MGKIKVVDSNGNWRDADWRPNVGGRYYNVRAVYLRGTDDWTMLYGPQAVEISDDRTNINLRDEFEGVYGPPSSYTVITFIVTGAIGSNSASEPALDVGEWPDGAEVKLVNQGEIIGAGGDGGSGADLEKPDTTDTYLYGGSTGDGGDGGPALLTRRPVVVENEGMIAGGGGGGGGSPPVRVSVGRGILYYAGSGGGGGAGFAAGSGGSRGVLVYDGVWTYAQDGESENGEDGGSEEGGSGGFSGDSDHDYCIGGKGGDLGESGEDAVVEQGIDWHSDHHRSIPSPGSGGDPGYAINGIGYVTFEREGAVRGPTT